MEFKRIAVIMAGGSGERFWPVSTKERPKQFLNLTSPDQSLLSEAAKRAADLVSWDNTYIATARHLAERSSSECPEAKVFAEPTKRNTTGCLAWVAANLVAQHPEDWPLISMAVLTADHRIAPTDSFHRTVTTALDAAESEGGLVTIGIKPDRPETGYGYIEVGEPIGGARIVRQFKEKPDLALAKSYLDSGNFLWNSGMFFWTLPAFLKELQSAQPDIHTKVLAMAGHLTQKDFGQAEEIFNELPSLSIDFALMEHASRVLVVEAKFEWDDLGAWDALQRSYLPDSFGNVSKGAVRVEECSGCVVYNDSPDQTVNVLGLTNVVVVVTDGNVMVCPSSRAQDVRVSSK
ncbi:MAG: mannose-1-phosphate guanylyltransferase [Chthonomonadaceae bacterium]|nr:mannose-1-phosphate guanylyltransferase [Chthonomonadaceae bacterium]